MKKGVGLGEKRTLVANVTGPNTRVSSYPYTLPLGILVTRVFDPFTCVRCQTPSLNLLPLGIIFMQWLGEEEEEEIWWK